MFECIALNKIAEATTAKALPYFLSEPITKPRYANSSAKAGTIATEMMFRIISNGVIAEDSTLPAVFCRPKIERFVSKISAA